MLSRACFIIGRSAFRASRVLYARPAGDSFEPAPLARELTQTDNTEPESVLKKEAKKNLSFM